jgi:hypothetical protein
MLGQPVDGGFGDHSAQSIRACSGTLPKQWNAVPSTRAPTVLKVEALMTMSQLLPGVEVKARTEVTFDAE